MEIAKKLEVDTEDALDEATLQDALHPQKNIARQKFAKPKGPGGRGPKRMVKKSEDGPESGQ